VRTEAEDRDLDVRRRLGYLLKHAELRLAELHRETLDPLGIDARELGVLIVLAGDEPQSQQEVGAQLSTDRTTMVAFIDALERKGLVARRPDPRDRRRNMVQLTEAGRTTLRRGLEASDKAEAAMLEPLGAKGARELRDALAAVIVAPTRDAHALDEAARRPAP
jgi:DNA-binding MarR family transcriptional regulator